MKDIIEGPPEGDDAPPTRSSRAVWFVVLWLGGLGVVAATAYGLRALIL